MLPCPARRRAAGRPTGLPLLAAIGWLVTACGGDDPMAWDFPDVCVPGQPPDEACYVAKRSPDSSAVAEAVAIADRWVAEHPPESLDWSWGEGTLLFALSELRRVTGDPRYRDYYRAYLDFHVARGYDIVWSDSCPPALAALALWQETGEATYLAVVEDVLGYLFDVAPRSPEGGISHMGTIDLFGETLWLDSLFMFGMLLTRWTETSGEPRALDLVGEQIRIFGEVMQDASGLLVHAAHWPAPQDPGVYWARGNAWVTVAAHDYLRARRLRGERDEAVAAMLSRQVEAVLAAQDPATGRWWTVLTRPGEIYLETSASALFAYGLARGYRYGLRDATVVPAVGRALAGVRAMIQPDSMGRPVVTGISGPTTAGDYRNYASVDLETDLPYGVAAAILALIETSGLDLR